MFGSFTTIFTVSAAVLASLIATAGEATAKPRIKDFNASVVGPMPTIYVDAKNGRYYRISDRPVDFKVRVSGNAKGVSNYIKHIGVGFQDGFAMSPADESTGIILQALAKKTFGGRGDKNKATAEFHIIKAGDKLRYVEQTRLGIIAACNKLVDQGRSPFEQHQTKTYPYAFKIGAIANY